MIQVGETLPDATVTETTEFGASCPIGPKNLSVIAQARGKRIVVFGVPGAYTPTCSSKHVPGYVEHAQALRARGVDEIWCISVNDGFVMAAWGRDQRAIGKVRMLGDGSAELTRKLGLERDIPGMGVRCRRFSMLVEDGTVRALFVEESGKFELSSAEAMLRQLEAAPARGTPSA